MARDTGFLKRQRKLTPSNFLNSLVFNPLDGDLLSLNDLSVDMQLRRCPAMRKQSIDERFTESSVLFVKSLFEAQLKSQITDKFGQNWLGRFSAVKIKDSTGFQLPACLKNKYPGQGGNASEAGLHIQFEFDLKSGTIHAFKPTESTRPDAMEAKQTIADIQPGELIIRDLGYFASEVIKQIDADRKAYYITRMSYGLKVYRYRQGRFVEVILEKELKALKRAGLDYQEIEVYLEPKLDKPLRLLMEVVPDEQRECRIRKARLRKRKELSSQYSVYASLGLFLTNIPVDWLKPEKIRCLYRLRWQIELRFKCWKSLCHIHLTKKMKLHRFETCLYARLLYVLINWEISIALSAIGWRKQKIILSIYKCFKTLAQYSNLLRESLFNNRRKLKEYFEVIESISYQNLCLEKRKNSTGFLEIMTINLMQND